MRRFKVVYVPKIHKAQTPDGRIVEMERAADGHVFSVHVQDPADKLPAMIETSPGTWVFRAPILDELKSAPGPVHVEYSRTNGIQCVVVPEYCKPAEAKRIVEVAVRDALAKFDEEESEASRVATYAVRRLRELRGALKEATAKEEYEEAARIRDEIKEVESHAD